MLSNFLTVKNAQKIIEQLFCKMLKAVNGHHVLQIHY